MAVCCNFGSEVRNGPVSRVQCGRASSARFRRDILWLSGGVKYQYGMSYMLTGCPKLVGALFDLAQFASQLGVYLARRAERT
jgi:hypothetical protein